MKKTLVLGASTKPERYGNIATRRLKLYNHEVVPVGNRAGEIEGIDILLGKPDVDSIDTMAKENGIEAEIACTLVLLSVGEY